MKKNILHLLTLVSMMLLYGSIPTWGQTINEWTYSGNGDPNRPSTSDFFEELSSSSYQLKDGTNYITINVGSGNWTVSKALKLGSSDVLKFTTRNKAKVTFGVWTKISGVTYEEGKEGVKLVDANNNTYTSNLLSDLTLGKYTEVTIENLPAGTYGVRRTNRELELCYVKVEELSAPEISLSETPKFVKTGTDVTLTATVTGDPTPTIQWYSCEDAEKTNAKAIDGATNSTYTFTASNTGTFYYYCTATNTISTTTSDVRTVKVVDRLPNTDATIKSIVINGILTAKVSGTTFTATTANCKTATAVVTTTDENATVTDGKTFTVTPGTPKTITVTAEDETTTAVYTLTVDNVNDKVLAENKFYVSNSETYAGGQSFIAPDITAKISETAAATGAMGKDNSKKYNPNSNYTVITSGSQNPSYTSLTGEPTKGNFFSFTPSKPGSLQVGVFLNSGKELWLSDGSRRLVYDTDFVAEFKNGEVSLPLNESTNQLASAGAGILTLDVEAGTTYYVYCTGSKLGWYGFEFTPMTAHTLTTTDNNFYGLYLKYDAVIPKEIEAYTGDLNAEETTLTLNKVEQTTLPKNTAVVVRSKNSTGDFTFDFASESSSALSRTNSLQGVTEETAFTALAETGKTVLTLGIKDGVVAFRKPAATTLKANRVYLQVTTPDEGSGPKRVSMVINDGETNGITEVRAEKADSNTPLYNLAGQRVNAGAKGLLIKNGKKYIIK